MPQWAAPKIVRKPLPCALAPANRLQGGGEQRRPNKRGAAGQRGGGTDGKALAHLVRAQLPESPRRRRCIYPHFPDRQLSDPAASAARAGAKGDSEDEAAFPFSNQFDQLLVAPSSLDLTAP